MKINEEVYALNITSELGITKEDIFLTVLKDKNSMVLIDTGYPGLYQNIHSAFQKDNLDITNLETIILSHQDIDHIGSAKLLKEQSQNKIKILSHEQEADYISGEKTPLKLITFEKKLKYMKEPEKADKIYKGMKRGYEMCYLNVDKTLKDNEVLPICGGVTILHTPGHTHGHICLYINVKNFSNNSANILMYNYLIIFIRYFR